MRLAQLRAGRAQPRRYRNRRIGEFLKELEFTEGRATGIPKIIQAMRKNGSPPAEFDFDEDHSYFMVRLPIHPAALEVAASVTGEEATLPVGTKSGLSRDQVLLLQRSLEAQGIAVLMAAFGQSSRTKFRDQVLNPLIEAGLIEMTIPDKPRSSKQEYQLTQKGRALLGSLKAEKG